MRDESWDDLLDRLDPETQSDHFETAIDREMTLEIGFAVRCHVRLDRVLHLTVAVLSEQDARANTSTSELISRIERAIQMHPLISMEVAAIAQEALGFARSTNRRRNRVLHDDWVARYDELGPRLQRWSTNDIARDIPASSETLEAILSVSIDLTTAYYRLFGLYLFVRIAKGLTPSEIEIQCANAVELMRATFKPLDGP